MSIFRSTTTKEVGPLLTVIVVSACILCMLMFYGGTVVTTTKYENVEKVLENQKDSLNARLLRLDIQCSDLAFRNQELQQEINRLLDTLKTVERKYNEEISSVSHYSNSELELFFADRYR